MQDHEEVQQDHLRQQKMTEMDLPMLTRQHETCALRRFLPLTTARIKTRQFTKLEEIILKPHHDLRG